MGGDPSGGVCIQSDCDCPYYPMNDKPFAMSGKRLIFTLFQNQEGGRWLQVSENIQGARLLNNGY